MLNTQFAKTTSATADKSIGTVTNAGPGPNQFMLRANTKIIDFMPALPGNPGDYLYTDNSNPGKLTTASTSGKVQFIKIANAIETSVTGTIADPTTTNNNVIEINEEQVTLTGTVTLAQIVSAFNRSARMLWKRLNLSHIMIEEHIQKGICDESANGSS